MVMPITQKCAAGAKAVPVLWRNCAWRVRIFVHAPMPRRADILVRSKLVRRQASAVLARRIPVGDLSGQECPMPLGFHLYPGGIPDNSPTFQRWVGVLKRAQVSKGRPKPPRHSAVPSGLPLRLAVVPNVETLGYCRSLRDKRLHRLGRDAEIECPRAGRTKGCAPGPNHGALNGAAKRLLPVLAFAASQLGRLSPACLRIYSVFEHPLPRKI